MAGSGESPFKLYEAKIPQFVVEIAPGDQRTYDPFAIIAQVEPIAENPEKATFKGQMDLVRASFKLPDITDGQAFLLLRALRQFVEGMSEVKKALVPSPNSPASST
jgi:hypothetical protein